MKKDSNDKEPDNKALLRLKLFEEAREVRATNKTPETKNKQTGKPGKSNSLTKKNKK
jgi:hypothetical protein